MRSRIILQPVIALTANTVQETRFARRVGHGNSAVAIVNVYRHGSGGGTMTFDIETAANPRLNATTNLFWKSCVTGGGNAIGTGVTGAVKFRLTDLGRFIRYSITNSSWPGVGADIDICVYFSDT